MTVQIDTTAEIDAVRLKTESTHPSAPASGHVLLYFVTGTANPGMFVEDSAGNKYGPFITGSSGGSGSDLVKVSSGIGTVVIPGLAGVPDKVPTSPNAADDEFDALSGWTTLGTLDTSNVTDYPSNWHAKRTNAGVAIDGIYKTSPSMPFTVTAKISASNLTPGANYNMIGILLTETSPGKCTTFGLVSNGGTIYASIYRWTNRTTLATNIDTSTSVSYLYVNQFPYIRIVVTASNNISTYLSRDGIIWQAVSGQQNVDSGLTVANVGLAIGDAAAAGTVESVFDWIRFT